MKKCNLCEAGDVPQMMDEDGTFVHISGKPGVLSHASGDVFQPCARAEELTKPFPLGRDRIDALWDKFSETIGDDIDSLQEFAGTTVLTHTAYNELMELL